MMETESYQLKERLKTFMENEARSCSMDYGCITPIYIYRMWGSEVPLCYIGWKEGVHHASVYDSRSWQQG